MCETIILTCGEKSFGELIVFEWLQYVEFFSMRKTIKCNAWFQKVCSYNPLERKFFFTIEKGYRS